MSRSVNVSRFLISTAALAGVLFICAGRLNLPVMWEYLGVYWGLGMTLAMIADVYLDAERREPGPGAIDPVSRPAASLLFLATVAVSALDAGRFHWSHAFLWSVQFSSLVAFTLAWVVQTWAMSANPFFSSAIRIQPERGHRVVTQGPYRFIRHPGYLAMASTMPSTALALGSLVALIPALLYSTLILWRLRQEDRFLREKLVGYSDYAAAVRQRLIPGVW
jgi:protein-S-isoprenylcysteine O-methyltransferase Ste14